MDLQEAIKIINEDEDWLDISKWKKRHYTALHIYTKEYYGYSEKDFRRLRKMIKKVSKMIQKGLIDGKITIPRAGSDGSSPEDA